MYNDTLKPFGNKSNPFNSICQDDSFYYVIGGVNNAIVKLNKQGGVVNKKAYYHYPSFYFQAYPYNSVVLSNNQIVSCAIATDTFNNNNAVVLSVDKFTLDTLWFKMYNHPDTLAASQTGAMVFNGLTAIKATPDGGYILTGNYNKDCITGKIRSYLLKIDSVGNMEWRRTYNSYYTFFDVEIASDSGYFVPCTFNNVAPLKLIKLNKNGVYKWSADVNSNSNPSYPMSISVFNNLVTVSSAYWYDLTNNLRAITVAKVDADLRTVIWEKNYYTFHSFECLSLHQAMGVETLSNGDIIVSGTAIENSMKGVILKLNSNGDSLWTKTYNYSPLNNYDCQLNDLIVTDDGGFMGVGFLSDQGGSGWTAWMFKTDANGVIGWEKTMAELAEVKVYPNPARDFTNIEFGSNLNKEVSIKVYNSLGQLVLQKNLNQGASLIKLDLEAYKSGVYFIEIVGKDGVLGSGTFVKE